MALKKMSSVQFLYKNSAQLPDLHDVGICTVQRSSDDSSVEVPIKSKLRQL